MKTFTQSIFDPAQHTKGIMGKMGSAGGARGGQFGHLGEEFGSLSHFTFDATKHFDVNKMFNPIAHFDPEKLLKRY